MTGPEPTAGGRRARAALVGLMLLPTALVGCGRKGEPLPPLRVVPARIDDLKISQQGHFLHLRMTYPAVTVAGLPLGGIDGVEVLELVKPATPEGGVPTLAPIELERSSGVLMTLRGAELNAAVAGDQIRVAIPLDKPLPTEPLAHFFAVRTLKSDEVSAISNAAAITPLPPPAPPSALQVLPGPEGIEITWESVGARAVGFDVYRRLADRRAYSEPPVRVPGDARRHLDRSARFGERYIYTVRSLASEDPLIQSSEAGEREVHYEDRYAPPLPGGFVALAEAGSVRLRWDASEADDVRGYVLYRREPGRDFHPITEQPVAETEYLDRGLASGFSYDYRIQVVDRTGNESRLSPPVTALVR